MQNSLVRSLFGLGLTSFGLACGFYYFKNIEQSTPLYLVISVILVIPGLYLLNKFLMSLVASSTGIDSSKNIKEPVQVGETPLESRLIKNNILIKQYEKTIKTRDDLKILSVSEEANKSKA